MSSEGLKPHPTTFLLTDHSLILWGRLKTPLLTRLRLTVPSLLNVVTTLRMILATPLQSALIYQLSAV